MSDRATPRARDPLARLGRQAPVALPCGLALGILLPDLATLARPLFTPSIVVMMALSMMRLDLGRVADQMRRPALLIGVAAWLLVGSPAAAALIGRSVGLGDADLVAVILSSAAPPVLASLAFALMLGLRAEMTLLVIVATLFLCPLTVPPMVAALAGVALDFNVADLMVRLALLIGAATVLGRGGRAVMGADRVQRAGDHLDGLLVIALTVFAVSIMDGVTARLLVEPGLFAWLTALVLALSLLHQALPLLAWPLLSGPTLATVSMICGYRNMGIIIAAMGDGVDADIFLFFVVAQVPIYCLPFVLRPAYRRLAARGRASAGARPP